MYEQEELPTVQTLSFVSAPQSNELTNYLLYLKPGLNTWEVKNAQTFHLPETGDLQSGTRDFERGVFNKCLQLNISNLFNYLLKIMLNAHFL